MLPRTITKYIGTPYGPGSRTRKRVSRLASRVSTRRRNRAHGAFYTWMHTPMNDHMELNLPDF